MHTPWLGAPDHMAWEFVLSNSSISYDTLIHYPHEGGTIMASLTARFIKVFTDQDSLMITAVIFDFISRFIQLYVVHKIFKTPLFFLFGAFTVLSVPAIIPFGTVNFGLHSLAACFPFIALYLMWLNKPSVKFHLWSGVFLGLALWFSYINVILIPIFFLHLLIARKEMRLVLYTAGTFLTVLALHIRVRYFADAGFHLNEFGIASIRGEEFAFGPDIVAHVYEIWWGPLSDSIIANPKASDYLITLSQIGVGILVIGLILGIVHLIREKKYKGSSYLWGGLLLILAFVMIYAISPFYYEGPHITNYVLYRHLTYILPLMALFAFWGYRNIRFGSIPPIAFILIGAISTGVLFKTFPEPNKDKLVVGWILGTKFGHDPEKLYDMVEQSEDRNRLYMGCGWGISSALFQDIDASENDLVSSKIDQLWDCFGKISTIEGRQSFLDGVQFAFEPYLDPKLDQKIYKRIEASITEMSLIER